MPLSRFLPVLFLCAAHSLFAAPPPTEFLDVPWDATVAEAKRVMDKRAGVTLKEQTLTKLVYEGGTFADYPVQRYVLEMPDGRFTRGTVFVVIPMGNASSGVPLRNQQFDALNRSLSGKYGKGTPGGGTKHAQSLWTWAENDPRNGLKRTTEILLGYWWDPYQFIVRYSSSTPEPKSRLQSTTPKPGKKDL